MNNHTLHAPTRAFVVHDGYTIEADVVFRFHDVSPWSIYIDVITTDFTLHTEVERRHFSYELLRKEIRTLSVYDILMATNISVHLYIRNNNKNVYSEWTGVVLRRSFVEQFLVRTYKRIDNDEEIAALDVCIDQTITTILMS